MAVLTPNVPTTAGTTLTLAAATATTGDTYLNTGKERIVVDNASGAPVTVTFKAVKGCNNGGTLHDVTGSVAAGAREFFAPVDPIFYNDDNGRTQVICSAVTSVTIGVL